MRRGIISTSVHKAQAAERPARKLVTEIVSIERRATLTTISAPALVQIVTTPELHHLLERPVNVHTQRVGYGASIRLVLQSFACPGAERTHAALRHAGDERAAERRVDIDETL